MNKQYIILSALAVWLSAGRVSTAATQDDYQNAVAEHSANYDKACAELTSNKTACIQQYKASLMVIKDKVLKAGDLDKVKVVNAQISLVTNSMDNPIFEVSDDMFPELKSATKQHELKYKSISTAAAKKTLLLLSNYDKTLETFQRQLTREENLMKAEEAQGLRKETASRISDITSELAENESAAKTATAKADEPASSGSNKIILIEATYGTGRKTLNVTDKVRKFVNNGKLILGKKRTERHYRGSYRELLQCTDPSKHEAKTLTIKYRLNGKITTEEFKDGQYIEIPAESVSE